MGGRVRTNFLFMKCDDKLNASNSRLGLAKIGPYLLLRKDIKHNAHSLVDNYRRHVIASNS